MNIPNTVLQGISLLNQAGFEAWLVGGCVRDTLLGIPPHDWDICTSATPSQMQQVFSAFRTIETGLKHGTLTVLVDEYPLEITTFRLDGEYLDGRHPKQVTFTQSLADDLSRRDFTINAMAFHPEKGLVDLFSGRKDCREGILRCVGRAATRFDEDALRILRALRFAARFGFQIEENTANAILLKAEKLHQISAERIAAELNGLITAQGAAGILQQFAPVVFTVLPALNQEKWAYSLSLLPHLPPDVALRWAALMHPLGEETARQILQQLKMSNQLRDTVCSLVRYHALPIAPDTLQHALMEVGDKLLFPLLTLQSALAQGSGTVFNAAILQEQARQLIKSGACYTLAHLSVKGSDLADLGITGPAIGQTLHHLLEQVALCRLPNEKEALLLYVQSAHE